MRIIYATKHGTTKNIVTHIMNGYKTIANKECEVTRLVDTDTIVADSSGEIVVIATPFYVDQPLSQIRCFLEKGTGWLAKNKLFFLFVGLSLVNDKNNFYEKADVERKDRIINQIIYQSMIDYKLFEKAEIYCIQGNLIKNNLSRYEQLFWQDVSNEEWENVQEQYNKNIKRIQALGEVLANEEQILS